MIWVLISSMVSTSNKLARYPMLPASPNTSGGSDRIAKKAPSAARPVTRYRRQVPTVCVSSCHATTGTLRRRRSTPCTKAPDAGPERLTMRLP